ncbi:MAG TPA: hypothetical protein VIG78_08480, partial [Gemmatimonadaceae bacterium]
MHSSTSAIRRALIVAAVPSALMIGTPSLRAQQVVGGDFDICDYCGDLVANTLHLRGRPGFGTNLGSFVL